MTTDPIKALVETAQEWCDAVDRGTSWDYWDHHFKDMKYKVLPAAIEALKPMADMVMVPRGLIQNIDKTGQNLLDAIMVRFPDLKEYPDLIHSTDIGKGLLEAIREFHLAWADLGADSILKMTDAEALAAAPPASPAPVDDGERVRAAKIEAFDEALSIAEGSYSYGEQQNEIIAGIRAALAAINGEK